MSYSNPKIQLYNSILYYLYGKPRQAIWGKLREVLITDGEFQGICDTPIEVLIKKTVITSHARFNNSVFKIIYPSDHLKPEYYKYLDQIENIEQEKRLFKNKLSRFMSTINTYQELYSILPPILKEQLYGKANETDLDISNPLIKELYDCMTQRATANFLLNL